MNDDATDVTAADRPQHVKDALVLMEQVAAGIELAGELLDVEYPSWRKPGGGRKAKASVGGHRWRVIYAELGTAWVNLGTELIEAGVPSWELPPQRTVDQKSTMRFSRDGSLDVSEEDAEMLDARAPSSLDPVRTIDRPSEPLYTLDEARAILEICTGHTWVVDLDTDGKPIGVRCENCDEKRSLR